MNTHRLQTVLLLTTLSAPCASSVSAQAFPEGYQTAVHALPKEASNVLVTGAGVIYFTGKELVRDDGKTKTRLLSFAQSTFGSFTICVNNHTVLFGESGRGDIYLVPIAGGTARKLANLKLNYDAAIYPGGWAIVSAKTGGFSAKNNDLVAVHLTTGKTDKIAELPGASGAVTVDAAGNLYYATASSAFPAPRGTVQLLRFDALAVAQKGLGNGKLDATNATVLVNGLDAASRILLDSDDDVILTDWMNNTLVEVNDANGNSPTATVLATYGGATVTASGLQFLGGTRSLFSRPEFEPFQPQAGGTLVVHETKFGSVSQLRVVSGQRPLTALSHKDPKPFAPFAIEVTGGPRAGRGLIALTLPPGGTIELSFHVQGYEQNVLWSASLLLPMALVPVAFDQQGRTALPLFNPGFQSPLTIVTQAYLTDSSNRVAGSSTPLCFRLR
ncbi:MAG: hypothetical protein ACYS5W_06275 [Planctomycetota bacterium]|jgi:hypothetical protein